MYSDRVNVDLDDLIEFRKRLIERAEQLSDQEAKTKRAIDDVAQTWKDEVFRKFASDFLQDVEQIKDLVEDLYWLDDPILKNYQEKLENYLGNKII